MDKEKIEQKVQSIQNTLTEKEAFAKETTEQIETLRQQYTRTKEEYDLLAGELKGLRDVLNGTI